MIRVRFAPSPTGPLHIGGVRTALYNYLFALKHKGAFILRIEDTDQQRFVEGAESYIIKSLEWCGITFDEGPHIGGPYGPYRQSERIDLYKKFAIELVEQGHAYYAFDTPEELEQLRKNMPNFQYDCTTRLKLRNSLTLPSENVKHLINSGTPYVIRIKMPENYTIVVDDLIRQKIEFNTQKIDDKVLYKSDGFPTYHLANVVDDHLMKITHVIRGEEWLPSAPLHVYLYDCLGWQCPNLAHLPLILKPNGQGKLSKRDGDLLGFPVFPCNWIEPKTNEIYAGYREWGYLPQAFINMIALLGWNPGTDQEIFNISEMIELFSLEKVQKSGARFDPDKAKWFNHQYILKTSPAVYLDFIHNILKSRQIQTNDDFILLILEKIKDRIYLLTDFWEHASYFFVTPDNYNYQIIKKYLVAQSIQWLNDFKEILKSLVKFDSYNIEQKLKEFTNANQIPSGKFFNLIRIALTGSSKGIGLSDIMHIIGKEETLHRFEKMLNTLKNIND